jgi:proline iminopeptidase
MLSIHRHAARTFGWSVLFIAAAGLAAWSCSGARAMPSDHRAGGEGVEPSAGGVEAAPAPSAIRVGVAYRESADGRRVAIPFVRRDIIGDRPILFVLGGPAPLEWFGRHLEPAFHVVYLVPVGESRRLSHRVLDIEAVREHLDLPRIALFGHSEDAAVVLEYTAAYPERITRLVWVAGLSDVPRNTRAYFELLSAHWPTPEGRARFAALARKDRFSPLELALSLQARRFAAACAHPERCRRAYARSGEALDALGVSAELRSLDLAAEPSLVQRLMVTAVPDTRGMPFLAYRSAGAAEGLQRKPVLMIQGALDRIVDPGAARDLAALLPHARYLEYERSAHEPFLDEPERFIADLRRFLEIDPGLPPEPSPLPADWRPDYDTAGLTAEQLDAQAEAAFSSRRSAMADAMLAGICRVLAQPPDAAPPGLIPDDAAGLRVSICSGPLQQTPPH